MPHSYSAIYDDDSHLRALEPSLAYKLQMAPLQPGHPTEKSLTLPGLSQQFPPEEQRRHGRTYSQSRVMKPVKQRGHMKSAGSIHAPYASHPAPSRGSIACANCRDRKLRCEGYDFSSWAPSHMHACHRCKREGKQCVFDPAQKDRGFFVFRMRDMHDNPARQKAVHSVRNFAPPVRSVGDRGFKAMPPILHSNDPVPRDEIQLSPKQHIAGQRSPLQSPPPPPQHRTSIPISDLLTT